jgi:hypothetical protein
MTEYYKIIERILDDESAWIGRPNKDVTNRIALGCALAVEKMILDLSRERDEARDVAAWVETWVSNPASAYSVSALDGLFAMTRDRIEKMKDRTP